MEDTRKACSRLEQLCYKPYKDGTSARDLVLHPLV